MNKQLYLTTFILILGVVFAGINFFVFQNLDEGFDGSLKKLANLSPQAEKAEASSFLPDISNKQPLSDSKLRNAEIAKIEKGIPYTDEVNKFIIAYDPKTKLIVAGIREASSVAQYRERKLLLEQKLYDLGADNICILTLTWAPPFELKDQLETSDIHTTGCKI